MKIVKIYTQSVPATRFIGKKYGDADRAGGGFGEKWGEAFSTGLFEKIEDAAGGAEVQSGLFEDSGSYIGLMRSKPGEPFEYWIGEFTAPGTVPPDGFEYRDFPASTLGVGWVCGSEAKGELYCHEAEVAKKLGEAGYKAKSDENGACWFFERYQCPRFTTPDNSGNVILDICFFI